VTQRQFTVCGVVPWTSGGGVPPGPEVAYFTCDGCGQQWVATHHEAHSVSRGSTIDEVADTVFESRQTRLVPRRGWCRAIAQETTAHVAAHRIGIAQIGKKPTQPIDQQQLISLPEPQEDPRQGLL